MLDRRRLIQMSAALAATAAAAPAGAATSARDQALATAFGGSGAPALASAVYGPDGMIWTGATGVRRFGDEDAVTESDLWHLASNAKAMTAMLYGKLVEDGRAQWGVVLPDLFPDLELDAAWSDTRVEDLMTHRAGLLDDAVLDMQTRMGGFSDTRPLDEQRTELARRAFAAPPTGEVGAFAYGNLNYILVGAAIERITGAVWEDAIRAGLFQPLGMTSVGFGAPTGDQPRGHMDLGGPVPVDQGPGSDNPPYLGPAGTAHMTLEDYGKFLILFLAEGGDFVTPGTIAKLTTPAEGGDYALGWIVRENSPLTGGRMLGHEGSNTLWHMTALVAPDRGLAVAAASNDHARGGPATQRLAALLLRTEG